jgi:hypothetical protein
MTISFKPILDLINLTNIFGAHTNIKITIWVRTALSVNTQIDLLQIINTHIYIKLLEL